MADIRCGEARAVLASLPEQSVHTCITSPPYFGLRSYNGGAQEIGTEQTPATYVAALVEVFRGVWRVLRDDGTLWVVLGDTYAHDRTQQVVDNKHRDVGNNGSMRVPDGLKAKGLIGIPWRVAFALQDDGWLLRQEVIWAKSNPMPESVKDRCTRAHETVFMLAKGPRYYYDQDAIAEPVSVWSHKALEGRWTRRTRNPCPDRNDGFGNDGAGANYAAKVKASGLRNKRTVWTVAAFPLSSKKFGCDTEHYAAYPPELVRPMVRAGCPPDGTVVDPFCGSGTTGFVAVQEGRRFLGCDINADYVRLAQARIATAQPALPLALMAEGLAI